MGGPCLVKSADSQWKRGPHCTSNFQLLPFRFKGRLYLSVEHAYQAAKFTSELSQKKFDEWCAKSLERFPAMHQLDGDESRSKKENPSELDEGEDVVEVGGSKTWTLGKLSHALGLEAWSLGQRFRDVRPDWDAVKVDVMYEAVKAKYDQYPKAKAMLLSTGSFEIKGGPSTWEWPLWNGLIQMRIREEYKAPAERVPGLLESIVAQMGNRAKQA